MANNLNLEELAKKYTVVQRKDPDAIFLIAGEYHPTPEDTIFTEGCNIISWEVGADPRRKTITERVYKTCTENKPLVLMCDVGFPENKQSNVPSVRRTLRTLGIATIAQAFFREAYHNQISEQDLLQKRPGISRREFILSCFAGPSLMAAASLATPEFSHPMYALYGRSAILASNYVNMVEPLTKILGEEPVIGIKIGNAHLRLDNFDELLVDDNKRKQQLAPYQDQLDSLGRQGKIAIIYKSTEEGYRPDWIYQRNEEGKFELLGKRSE